MIVKSPELRNSIFPAQPAPAAPTSANTAAVSERAAAAEHTAPVSATNGGHADSQPLGSILTNPPVPRTEQRIYAMPLESNDPTIPVEKRTVMQTLVDTTQSVQIPVPAMRDMWGSRDGQLFPQSSVVAQIGFYVRADVNPPSAAFLDRDTLAGDLQNGTVRPLEPLIIMHAARNLSALIRGTESNPDLHNLPLRCLGEAYEITRRLAAKTAIVGSAEALDKGKPFALSGPNNDNGINCAVLALTEDRQGVELQPVTEELMASITEDPEKFLGTVLVDAQGGLTISGREAFGELSEQGNRLPCMLVHTMAELDYPAQLPDSVVRTMSSTFYPNNALGNAEVSDTAKLEVPADTDHVLSKRLLDNDGGMEQFVLPQRQSRRIPGLRMPGRGR